MRITLSFFILGLTYAYNTYGRTLRGIRHNYRSIAKPIPTPTPTPTPTPSPGLKEYVLPIYNPPVETQELIPPSPLPSLVSVSNLNHQKYLGLPTPYPKVPESLIYHPSPSPSIIYPALKNDYYPVGSYSLGTPILMLPFP